MNEGSGAVLSPCGRYRYQLWRRWADGPAVLFADALRAFAAGADIEDCFLPL